MKLSHDSMPSEAAALRFIDGAGNHELKTILSGIFLTNPERHFTASGMANEINQAQGAPLEEPFWKIKPAAIIQYCGRSLEPVGAVIKNKTIGTSGKEVDAWRATSECRDTLAAMSGFLSTWGLRWSELSVQQVYGVTSSRGEVRSPVVRHRLYSALVNSPLDQSAKDLDITLGGAGYKNSNSLTNQMHELADLGIIDLTSKRKDYDPEILINDAEYRHIAIKFEDTIPETKALYSAIAKNGVGTVIRVNALIDHAKKLDPTIDTIRLREQLVKGLHSASGNFPGLKKIDTDGLAEDAFTLVRLTPQVQEPIKDLVLGIEEIAIGQITESSKAKMVQILANPMQVRQLVAKAAENSPFKTGHDVGAEKLRTQIASIVQDSEAVTAAEVRKLLLKKHGRRITTAFARTVLNELASEGNTKKSKTTQHSHSTRKLNQYSQN